VETYEELGASGAREFFRVATDSCSCLFSRTAYAVLLSNYSNNQRVPGNKEPAQSVLPSHWRDRHQANDFCRGSGHQSDLRLFFPDLLKELKGMSSNVTGALSYCTGVNYIQRLKPQQGILVQRISFPKGGSIISWTSLQSDQNLRCPRIVWPCPISAANRPHVSAAVDQRDRQTKGRALDRFIISHTMRNA